jgi:NADPH-dependent curcumin reductase CurA
MVAASREVHLIARPNGMPREEEFAIVEQVVPDASDGEIQVKNAYLSVDPAMRPRLSVGQPLNEPLAGYAIGRVVQSRHPSFREGDLVQNWSSFREYFVSSGNGVSKLTVDSALPVSLYLHTLGGSGFVAYGGLLEIGKLQDGEQVFVSTAAGSVGSVAVQIAKIKGCYVIGSTGSDEKCRWLKDDLGIDAVINYKTETIRTALKERAPNGIDVYFDNVGGDHLEAALGALHTGGRVAMCGAIASYCATEPPAAPRNLGLVITKRLTLRGFIVTDHVSRTRDMIAEVGGWLREGKLAHAETVVDGLDQAPDAFISLLRGGNTGKMIIRLTG